MEPERWKQVDELLQSALLVPSDRREEFLRQACAGDAELEQEVRSLLTSHRNIGDFLEDPAIKVAAQTIALAEAPEADCQVFRGAGDELGYNAATGKYEDLVKAGVIDPLKVTRTALKNAVSVAMTFLSLDAVVYDEVQNVEQA